jgi:HEPN domain-containing protein
VNRSDLQRIADLRVRDAEVLLAGGQPDGAYYLLGYAVECALKSCIAKQIREHEFPDRKLVNDSYVHNLEKLLKVSGINEQLDAEENLNRAFEANWTVVKDWSEERRYQHSVTEKVARDFFAAVTDPTNGVLTWLKKYW